MPCPIIMESSPLTLYIATVLTKAHSTADDFEVPFASWRWFAGASTGIEKRICSLSQAYGALSFAPRLTCAARCRQKASGSTLVARSLGTAVSLSVFHCANAPFVIQALSSRAIRTIKPATILSEGRTLSRAARRLITQSNGASVSRPRAGTIRRIPHVPYKRC